MNRPSYYTPSLPMNLLEDRLQWWMTSGQWPEPEEGRQLLRQLRACWNVCGGVATVRAPLSAYSRPLAWMMSPDHGGIVTACDTHASELMARCGGPSAVTDLLYAPAIREGLRRFRPAFDEQELLDLLVGVERGQFALQHQDGGPGYCGIEPYITSHGWRLEVFNDCEEWDYLERITAPDGRTVEYEDLLMFYHRVAEYQPTTGVYGLDP